MEIYRLSKLFKALSDPTRLEIITLLSFRAHCVCELVNIIGLSQPTVSRHLQVLTEAGLISFERSKFFIIYKLSPKNEFIAEILKTTLEELKRSKIYEKVILKTSPIFQSLMLGTKNLQGDSDG